MFNHNYGVHNTIALNSYHIVPPIVCNLNVVQPWATKQRGITRIQLTSNVSTFDVLLQVVIVKTILTTFF